MKTDIYKRTCPRCRRELVYSSYCSWFSSKDNPGCNRCSRIGKKHSEETKKKIGDANKLSLTGKKLPDYVKEKMSLAHKGKKVSEETKKKLSLLSLGIKRSDQHKINTRIAVLKRYTNPDEKIKTSRSTKKAMRRPDVRKKHLQGLLHSKWLRCRTDKGQLELLEKWNRMGFLFEPNYQIHTEADLFYIDGYDKEKNVVLEYDSKYHQRSNQKQKDLIRQNKIIDILKPKKFWRYEAENKQCKNVLESIG